VVADPEVLRQRASLLGLNVELNIIDLCTGHPPPVGCINVIPVSTRKTVTPGELNPANAAYVLDTLNLAVDHCNKGYADAMVTGPVHKGVINDADIPFSGHTEYLAQLTGTPCPVMMLASEHMRVALVTTHVPLSHVPAMITAQRLSDVLHVLHQDLNTRFAITEPRILVAGLNPHAGEGGHLGNEDDCIIRPVIEQYRDKGWRIEGPIPADTLFQAKLLAESDAVLTMYHDQGLPVLKYQSFGRAVNITLGLPIIRTSVDHGTALTLAGSGKADHGSLIYAVETALRMAA